jgi:hypothetical protein
MRAILVLLLAGCATEYNWTKPGMTEYQLYQENGQCQERAYSVPNSSNERMRALYESCMQGKGYFRQ